MGDGIVTDTPRMTPDAFRAALTDCGLGVQEFCRYTGTDIRTARRWLSGDRDIPGWVRPLLELHQMVTELQRVVCDLPDCVAAAHDAHTRDT